MIVWNPEPTKYGDYNGRLAAIGAYVTVERRGAWWRFFVWGATDVSIAHSHRDFRTADEAKRAAEAWAGCPTY